MHKSVFFFVLICVSWVAHGQQNGLNYQAVILDPNPIEIPGQVISGQPLASGNVWIRFTLVSPAGIDYEEIHAAKTDAFGLVNLVIGKGTPAWTMGANAASGESKYKQFDTILWDEKLKRLTVSVNFNGSASFAEVSNQLLTFTPYALYAASVDYKNVRDSPTKLSQFSNDVGYLVPKDLDPLKQDIRVNTVAIQESSAKIEANQQANKIRFIVIDQSISDMSFRLDSTQTQLVAVNVSLNSIRSTLSAHDERIKNTANASSSLASQLSNLQNQTSQMANSFEMLSNKSTALDLGNSRPSNSLYPSQLAVKSYVDNAMSNVITTGTPDATTLATGKLQLAGDLAGMATNPTVPGLVLKEILTNKSTDVMADATSNQKYPSVKAVKDYVDIATTGVAFQAALDAKANLNSPVFTGTPVLPTTTTGVTQTAGNNSTLLATTGFVQSAMVNANVVDADATTKGKVQLAGDLGGTAASPTIARLQGATLSSLAPTSGQVLKYNGTAWVPDAVVLAEAQTLSLTGTTVTLSGTNSSVTLPTVADATTTVTGKVQLAGDLGGTAAAPLVAKLQGVALSSILPTTGQVLKYNGTAWVPDAVVLAEAQTLGLVGSTLTISGTGSSVTLPSVADATTLVTGKIQLAGDLSGTATSPTVPGLLLKSNIASPTFTGIPLAPTATPGTDNTQIATTAFVMAATASSGFSGILPITSGGTGSTTQNFVDLSTIQSIGGAKTFSANTAIGGTLAVTGATTLTGLSATTGALSSTLTVAGTTTLSGNLTANGTGNSLGTITSGIWNGTTVAVGRGGTGATTLTGILKGNGINAFTAAISGTDYSLVRETSDEYVALSGQTVFTLNQTPATSSLVKLHINGIRINKSAISVTGTSATYIPANNGATILVANDRIQIDYFY